jgi:hypothetical protein
MKPGLEITKQILRKGGTKSKIMELLLIRLKIILERGN